MRFPKTKGGQARLLERVRKAIDGAARDTKRRWFGGARDAFPDTDRMDELERQISVDQAVAAICALNPAARRQLQKQGDPTK